jgi:PAS domain S-box-containing protein
MRLHTVAGADRFPRIASILAFVAATTVLIGWFGDFDLLKRGGLGPVAMNPTTAVLFLFAALSLWLQAGGVRGLEAPAAGAQSWARFAALVIVVVGLLRLSGYLFDNDIGIDRWLFADRLAAAQGPLPNRVAPNTAFNFVGLGFALLLLDRTTRGNRRPAEPLAIIVALVSLLALIGYAYGVQQLYGVGHYIPMALPTAGLFFMFALAILYARPASGLMAVFTKASAGGMTARRVLPAMVGSMFVLGWLRLEGERQGLYGAEFGVAVYTVAIIAILCTLVWWSAISLDRSEARRRQVEQERERFFAVSPDLMCVAGFDGYFKSLNPAWEVLLGHSREELLARPFVEFVHPDDRAATAARMEAMLAGAPVTAFENRFCRRDGDYRWFSWNAIPVTGDQLVYATARDITAQKADQERLRQSEEHVRSIIDTAHDAFVAIDSDGLVCGWNARAESTFGWTRADVLGQRLSELIVPPQFREAHEAGLRRFLETRQGPVMNRNIELTALDRGGREFPIELTIWPVRAGAGYSFNAFARDITERKRAEDSILALNTELGANAAQLQEANRELEAFSYTISHDLRAPLRHIDGYARMLKEDAAQLEPELRRYLDAIGTSARTMGMLIDDLLAFSRLGRKPVDRVPIDMTGIARSALHELGSDASAAAVVLGDLPEAHADPVLLKQVWINLLSNALKYSAPRGTSARVELSGERDGAVARYRIRDNGVGFDMRYADKLFGVFQRLHSQDEFEGTGVGLAIVQRIVARHGGRIWAEAEPGRGATFTMELPLADAIGTEDIA